MAGQEGKLHHTTGLTWEVYWEGSWRQSGGPVELGAERILPFMRGHSTCAQGMAVADVVSCQVPKGRPVEVPGY